MARLNRQADYTTAYFDKHFYKIETKTKWNAQQIVITRWWLSQSSVMIVVNNLKYNNMKNLQLVQISFSINVLGLLRHVYRRWWIYVDWSNE